MKKALVFLAVVAVALNFGIVGFAKQPCPCSKPCSVTTKVEKQVIPAVQPALVQPVTVQPGIVQPVVKKEEVKGQKTGGAAELVRPINMTKEQKLEKAKKDLRKEAVESKKQETK